MATRLRDDQIQWILSLDAKGVQSELKKISSQSQRFRDDNKKMEAEIKAAQKQMRDAEKEMEKLTKAGKTNSIAYREAQNTFNSAASDVADYTRRIQENNRAIRENEALVDEMTRTLRIEEMTMTQLRQRARELETQLNNTAQATDPDAYRDLETRLNAVRERMGELGEGSRNTFDIFKGGLAVFAGNMMTSATGKLKEWIKVGIDWVKEGINIAGTAEGIITAFNKLNRPYLLKNLRAETKGLVDDVTLMQAAVSAQNFGIPVEKLGTLLKFAQQRAQETGESVDYLVDSIVRGIGRKSVMILDNLQITQAEIKARTKENGDFTAGVIDLIDEKLQKQGDLALISADKKVQSEVKWQNAQLKTGQMFQWIGNLFDDISGNIADKIIFLTNKTKSLTEEYQDQLNKVTDLETNMRPLANRYDELTRKTSLNKNEQKELDNIIKTLGTSLPAAVIEFDRYGNALSINTQKVRDYIAVERTRLQLLFGEQLPELEKEKKRLENRQKILDKLFKLDRERRQLLDKERVKYAQEAAKITGDLEDVNRKIDYINGTTYEKEIERNVMLTKKREEFNNMNKKQLDAWIKDEKNANTEYYEIAKQIYEQRFTSGGGGSGGGQTDKVLIKEKKDLSTILENLETTHNKKLAKIHQDYLDGEIKTEAELNRKKFAQEQAYNLLREEKLKEYLKKTKNEELRSDLNNQLAELQDKRLEQEIKFRSELEKIILDADPIEKEKRAYDERLSAVGLFGLERESMNAEQLAALELLEKQHFDNLDKIRLENNRKQKALSENQFKESFASKKEELQLELNNLQQQAASVGRGQYDSEMAVHLQRMKMIQEEINARKAVGLTTEKQTKELGNVEAQMTATVQKELQNRAAQFKQYGNTVGQSLGDVMTGQQDALQAFGNASIDIVFDVLSNIIEAELIKVMASSTSSIMRATAEAMSTPQSAMSFGAAGFATAAILTGAITAATVAAKAALKGLLGKRKSSDTSNNNKSGGSGFSGGITVKNGYAEGGYHEGYTGSGGKYDVKGFFPDGEPYHAGEYIIPKEKLKIPIISQWVRQIDSIGKPNTKNPLPDGFAEGGYHNYNNGSSYADPVQSEMLQLLKVLNKKGVKATTVLGMSELDAEQKTFNREQNRFTRK